MHCHSQTGHHHQHFTRRDIEEGFKEDGREKTRGLMSGRQCLPLTRGLILISGEVSCLACVPGLEGGAEGDSVLTTVVSFICLGLGDLCSVFLPSSTGFLSVCTPVFSDWNFFSVLSAFSVTEGGSKCSRGAFCRSSASTNSGRKKEG